MNYRNNDKLKDFFPLFHSSLSCLIFIEMISRFKMMKYKFIQEESELSQILCAIL